ncbi:MAG: flagellar export chaperone FliS [Gammaproteobacteria bacterium]|nr:MAG: flagellar export chaperone FliS [Gammaproteobacteria bacterium]
MSNYNSQEALKQYRQLGLETQINNASPHRLIQLLMDGTLDRLKGAKAAMDRGDSATKGVLIGKAMAIISGLRSSLNMDVENSDLPERLDGLYDYMGRRLLEASTYNKSEVIEEVIDLMKTIKSGWDGIEQQSQL